MSELRPYEECPSYISCSCNKCPLDPDIDERVWDREDDKCVAQKPTRKRIGEKYKEILPPLYEVENLTCLAPGLSPGVAILIFYISPKFISCSIK